MFGGVVLGMPRGIILGTFRLRDHNLVELLSFFLSVSGVYRVGRGDAGSVKR